MAGGVFRFGVLGPLVFEREGQPIALPSGRQRSLLALLLLARGAPLARDRLIDELWGERPPRSAVSALHVHLSKLRALLGGLLELDTAGYALRVSDVELDVWRFDELVEAARTDGDQALTLLREALALFRGEPLCDVAAEGSVAQWRRALDGKRLHATLLRIDAELERGASAELIPELEQFTAEHSFEERGWAQLMLALYRSGRQADALAAYQRVRRLYAEQLGLDPGEELARLQVAILEHDGELLAPPKTALRRAPTVALASSNLPRPVTRLVGRQDELRSLADLMADPDTRLLTLTGPGGVGKTRLLLELATRHEHEYADGAVFVRLERVTDPALVAAEIASALARRDSSEGPTADTLPSYLSGRQLLLVIDNFEHLQRAAILPAELLAVAPSLRVLVSSRTPLRIRGEHIFEVEPLALPVSEDEQALAESPAVQMFLQRAQAANRKLEFDVNATRMVATICRALDGLPLAIELAAARSQSLSPAQIAEQLTQPLSIGTHALRDLPERQQSLQATIRWSYELLDPGAQQSLRAAAAFVGGFTLDALESVLSATPDEFLTELCDANLVRRNAEGDRFELFDLVRAFALKELKRSGESAEVHARHRRYFAALLAPTSAALEAGGLPGELAPALLADHANLRAALDNAIDGGDRDVALALALGLRTLWFAEMLRQEAHELAERLLARFELSGADELRLLRAEAFVEGSSPIAATLHQRVAQRAAEIGDWTGVCTATCNLFGMALNTRNVDEMRRLKPRLLELVKPHTDAKALGWIHLHLSMAGYIDGELDQAVEHASQSVKQALAVDHAYLLATAVQIQLLASWARDGVIAQRAIADGVDRMRRTGVKTDAVVALWFVARYAASVDPPVAGQWLAHAERILAELNSEIWPESILRDETLRVLAIDDLDPFLTSTPMLDHAAAVAAAGAWLAGRDPAEEANAQLTLVGPMTAQGASSLPGG